MVTVRVAATNDVVMVNTGDEVAPAATVTEAGTVTPGSLLDRFTTALPWAGPLSVTLFAVVEVPPATDVGDIDTESRATGFTVRLPVLVTPS